ncbi:MAG TPA: amidase [Roseiarcus sp.]|nr:amidase [Roseiarcus sp.]
MADLWQLAASELAALIAKKQASCGEVVESHLGRIEAVNHKVNAIVKVLADEARKDAAEADRKIAAGQPLGPLHGVPFTIKENIDFAGTPTTWGVTALANAIVPVDAPVVERMRAAGAIPIGRTNLPDMALRVHTDSSLHGLTRNPWNPVRTAGGSSGGEAVALATGMSAVGLGNDIGGSLRNPANACGVASIRPSFGRVPDAGFVPTEDHLMAVQLMNAQGPMARRVADVRLALKVIAGAHPRDPWSIDAPFESPRDASPIRVAMVAEPPGSPTDPAVAKTVRDAGAALRDAGYAVDEVAPPRFEDAVSTWAQFIVADFLSVREQLLPIMGKDGAFFFEAAASMAPALDAAGMSRMYTNRHGVARAWSQFMAEHPLVLSPTWTRLPFEVGFDAASSENVGATLDLIRPVVPANLLGLPSACVPAGHDSAAGLPIGVLITGRPLRDDECLNAAEAIETRLGIKTPIDPR